jgi:hypothetical protein
MDKIKLPKTTRIVTFIAEQYKHLYPEDAYRRIIQVNYIENMKPDTPIWLTYTNNQVGYGQSLDISPFNNPKHICVLFKHTEYYIKTTPLYKAINGC